MSDCGQQYDIFSKVKSDCAVTLCSLWTLIICELIMLQWNCRVRLLDIAGVCKHLGQEREMKGEWTGSNEKKSSISAVICVSVNICLRNLHLLVYWHGAMKVSLGSCTDALTSDRQAERQILIWSDKQQFVWPNMMSLCWELLSLCY